MRTASRSGLSWALGGAVLAVASGVAAVVPACGSAPNSQSWGSSAEGGQAAQATGQDATTGPAVTTDSGGTPSSGGNDSGGAAADSGSSSADSGGALADGAPSATDAAGSSGCGAASWPMPTGSPPAGSLPIQTYTISVNGTMRDYIVGLPTNYNANQKYPVVFGWHGQGGTASQVATGGTSAQNVFGGYYGLRYQSNQTNKPMIFVAGQGLDANDAGAGWPNTNGQDVAFTQAMVAWLEQNYCVDIGRIYSVGMSYGGIMSNTLGCAMGDVFRAITPMSGLGPAAFGPSPSCKGHVAAWLAHGTQDMTVAFDAGQASRDFWVKANHCSNTTMPTTPTECVAYQGCDPGYPVDWCTFDGGHTVVSFEPLGIWAFLQQF
jgi:polyhydroxybutyrate depolymerase